MPVLKDAVVATYVKDLDKARDSKRAASDDENRSTFSKTDLPADCADYTDRIGCDYQCPEVLPRKRFVRSSPITSSKSLKSVRVCGL